MVRKMPQNRVKPPSSFPCQDGGRSSAGLGRRKDAVEDHRLRQACPVRRFSCSKEELEDFSSHRLKVSLGLELVSDTNGPATFGGQESPKSSPAQPRKHLGLSNESSRAVRPFDNTYRGRNKLDRSWLHCGLQPFRLRSAFHRSFRQSVQTKFWGKSHTQDEQRFRMPCW